MAQPSASLRHNRYMLPSFLSAIEDRGKLVLERSHPNRVARKGARGKSSTCLTLIPAKLNP
jgi:hypothetical protein